MATLERLLDSAREEELHVLGICLGSQMIAHCIAGSSVGSGVRMEAGITDLQWRDGKGPQVLPSFHYERIEEGPLRAAGAQIEAWNSRVPVLAFTMGPRIGGSSRTMGLRCRMWRAASRSCRLDGTLQWRWP